MRTKTLEMHVIIDKCLLHYLHSNQPLVNSFTALNSDCGLSMRRVKPGRGNSLFVAARPPTGLNIEPAAAESVSGTTKQQKVGRAQLTSYKNDTGESWKRKRAIRQSHLPSSYTFLGRVTDRGQIYSPAIWPAQVYHQQGSISLLPSTNCPSPVTLP